MKSVFRTLKVSTIFLFVLVLPFPAIADNEQGIMVVANRASGSISVINVMNDHVMQTIALPSGNNTPQPMYVVHSPRAKSVFVGDRANNRVVVFDDETFDYKAAVPVGNGVFHMWVDFADHQLWVNNDIDKTVTVIDPVTLNILSTVSIPADLATLGGKPHDVIVDTARHAAYVTIVGALGDVDYVVRYDTRSFQETSRAEVGKDPHVSLNLRDKHLYVPTQNSNAVYVLDKIDLSLVNVISLPAAHGAGMARKGDILYVSNISGGGTAGLFTIDTKNNAVIGNAVDTPYAVPHNLAVTDTDSKLYVTHSGATSDKVSVFTINMQSRLPELSAVVTVGLNPFGLAFVR